MRKYVKPELDIVEFDGMDVITMSNDDSSSTDSAVTLTEEQPTITSDPGADQASQSAPLVDQHSAETDTTADDSASTDDSVLANDAAPAEDAAPTEDAADSAAVEETAPQAEEETVAEDTDTVE